ncbi:MAG: DUF2795 domain-containing protein [Thermoleophilia bacterium]|nr:DUF2795 domain-containing protein [Thermoleophilia bacterium]
MAEVTPFDIQRQLGGMEYPASKRDLVDQARASGADEAVLSRLESLPDREFEGPAAVTKALGG